MRGIPDSWIQRVVAELRQPVWMDEEFDRNVMSVVRSLPRHRYGPWARALRPRTIAVRPLRRSVAAVFLLVVALSLGHAIGTLRAARRARTRSEVAADRAASARVTTRRAVQFVLVAPTARKVQVV